MTEAGWTREKPTVAGWYWWHEAGRQPEVIHVIRCGEIIQQSLMANFASGRKRYLRDVNGQFKGPITPDSYQQGWVAGIKAVRRKITDLIDRGFTDYEEDMDGLIDWIDFQLAQQAQEGGVGDAEN